MVIETSLAKSRALAKLATATFYDSHSGHIERIARSAQKRKLHASLVIQVEALCDSDIIEDEDRCAFFEDEEDEDFPTVPWAKRSKKEREEINMRIRWHEAEFPKDLCYWILAGYYTNYTNRAKFTRFSLITSLKRRPEWHIDVVFGPTPFSAQWIEDDIRSNFRHYRGAGDLSYSIRSIQWKEV